MLWMFMWERGAQEQGLCLQTPEPLPDQLQNCSWSGKKKRVSHLLDMEEGGGVPSKGNCETLYIFGVPNYIPEEIWGHLE